MANRISVLVALDGADEGLKRAITSAEKSLGELSASAKSAGDKAAAGMAEVKAGMSAFGEQVDRALARDPGNARYHFSRGVAQARLGQDRAAAESFATSRRLTDARRARGLEGEEGLEQEGAGR